MKLQFIFFLCLIAAAAIMIGCRTVPAETPLLSPVEKRQDFSAGDLLIMGIGRANSQALVDFFLSHNPDVEISKIRRLAAFYVAESRAEGVNPDVAFVQMCLETGFLRFGGLVTVDMNNFCGLGSIGPGQPGLSFPDEQTGVRAHVQHLKAYGSTEPLVGDLVDPRYRYVNPKGKAPDVHGLAGTWASDRDYGIKLEALLRRLYG